MLFDLNTPVTYQKWVMAATIIYLILLFVFVLRSNVSALRI